MDFSRATLRTPCFSSFDILSGFLRTSFRATRDAAPMTTKQKALAFVGLAVAALSGGCGAALVLGRFEVALVAAGFVAYVVLGRQAMILWRVDDIVFDHGRKRTVAAEGHPARLVAAVLFLWLLAGSLFAQQTIFNVPSADVLDKGHTYLEADALGRPQDPSFGF